MAIGIFLVVIIILFQVYNYLCITHGFHLFFVASNFSNQFLPTVMQGMKLLPTGRKNFLYITIYGSVVSLVQFWLMFIWNSSFFMHT